MKQNFEDYKEFDLKLWMQMLDDELPFLNQGRPVSCFHAADIYQRTVVAWGQGMSHYAQDGMGGAVDLTKLYEQCKLVSLLKLKEEN
jgi:hypothetical protein